MWPWTKYPYTNFQELNLDWILKTVKDLVTKTDNIDSTIVDNINNKLEQMNKDGELTVSAADDTARAEIAAITDDLSNYLLRGKKICVYGDSIAYGQIDAIGTKAAVPWPERMASVLGATVENRAISGATMTAQNAFSFRNIVDTLTYADMSQFDYIILAYGNNDVGLGVEIEGSDKRGFGAAYRYSIDKLQNLVPTAKIILCTDTFNGNPFGQYPPSNITAAAVNEKIREVARAYNLPVIDFEAYSGVNSANLSALTWDGLHFNSAGYLFLGDFAARCFSGTRTLPRTVIKNANIDAANMKGGDTFTLTNIPVKDWRIMIAVTGHDNGFCVGCYDRTYNTQISISLPTNSTGTVSYINTSNGVNFVSLTVSNAAPNQISMTLQKFGTVTTIRSLFIFV